MDFDKELLDILACPETKQDLELADPSTVDRINAAIAVGKLINRAGKKVEGNIDGALLRVGDTKYAYPIRGGIPILLVEELISIENL